MGISAFWMQRNSSFVQKAPPFISEAPGRWVWSFSRAEFRQQWLQHESKAEPAIKVLFCILSISSEKGIYMIKVTDLVNYWECQKMCTHTLSRPAGMYCSEFSIKIILGFLFGISWALCWFLIIECLAIENRNWGRLNRNQLKWQTFIVSLFVMHSFWNEFCGLS